jgi:hypothetical protein
MPPRKGQNNFADSQTKKVQLNENLIRQRLREVRRGAIFINLGALVDYISEKTKIHRTTLRRNPIYLKLLLEWLQQQPGASSFVKEEDASEATRKVKILEMQITISNLKKENLRLKSILATEEKYHVKLPALRAPYDELIGGNLPMVQAMDTKNVDQIAIVLIKVLEHLAEKELGILVDAINCQIIDSTEVDERRVIVSAKRVKPFLDWLEANKYVLNLKNRP